MKKIWLLLLLLAVGPASADSADEFGDLERALYRVEKNGHVMCLAGVHHITPALRKVSKQFKSCFDSAKILGLEAIPKSNYLEIWKKYTVKPDAHELSYFDLPEKLRKKIERAVLRSNFDGDIQTLLSTIHPIAIYQILMTSKLLNINVDFSPGLDAIVYDGAKTMGLKVVEFEGFEKLIESDKKTPLDICIKKIDAIADVILDDKKISRFKKETAEYFRSSQTLRAEEMYVKVMEHFHTTLGFSPADMYYELDARNAMMTEKLIDIINNNSSSLAIVGAAHLGGEKSILKLLVKNGYSVELFH